MAQEVKRTLVFSKEAAFGTKPAKNTGKILPRIETSLNSNFEAFQSEEIRPDLQRAASIIGFEKVEGDIKGELSAGNGQHFLPPCFVAILPLKPKPRLSRKPVTERARKTARF